MEKEEARRTREDGERWATAGKIKNQARRQRDEERQATTKREKSDEEQRRATKGR